MPKVKGTEGICEKAPELGQSRTVKKVSGEGGKEIQRGRIRNARGHQLLTKNIQREAILFNPATFKYEAR